MYPFVYKVIRHIKEGNYKLFAKLLQRLESSLVLGVVCRDLSRQNKDIPLFTVHDAILTTPQHAQTVKTLIESVLLEAVQFDGRVEIKDKKFS